MENRDTEKRILIHQDDALLKAILGDLNLFLKPLTKLKQAYEALQIGDFNEKAFKELIYKGENEIVAAYKKSLTDQLDNTGVINSTLRSIVLQGSEEPIDNLTIALNELKQVKNIPTSASILSSPRTQTLLLSDISFKNGVFGVYDTESILERHCRVYLETDEAKNAYSNLEKIQQAMQEYVLWIDKMGLPRGIYGGSYTDGLGEFFKYNPETLQISIKPKSIQWALSYKSEVERMRQYNGRR